MIDSAGLLRCNLPHGGLRSPHEATRPSIASRFLRGRPHVILHINNHRAQLANQQGKGVSEVAAKLATEAGAGHGISFSEAFRVWLRVALLSFGGPAGQIAV